MRKIIFLFYIFFVFWAEHSFAWDYFLEKNIWKFQELTQKIEKYIEKKSFYLNNSFEKNSLIIISYLERKIQDFIEDSYIKKSWNVQKCDKSWEFEQCSF